MSTLLEKLEKGEYDYEGQMARTQLQTTMRNCKDLIGMIEDDENMPEWVQSKITLAQDYITAVRDYLQSKQELGESTAVKSLTGSEQHKVVVTISDPNHPAVTQRNTKIMKHVIVKAKDKSEATSKATAFYKKKGFKVHDAEYHSPQPNRSMKTE